MAPRPWAHFHQIGDIILTGTPTCLSRFLCLWQALIRPHVVLWDWRWPRFSHVLICVVPGVFYHANGHGVDRVYAEQFPLDGSVSRISVMRRLDRSDTGASVDIQFLCIYHHRKQYNYLFNLSYWFPSLFDRSLYCSELASVICERMGVKFGKRRNSVVPFDIELEVEKGSGWINVTDAYIEADKMRAEGRIDYNHPVDGRKTFELILKEVHSLADAEQELEKVAADVQRAFSSPVQNGSKVELTVPTQDIDVIESLTNVVENLLSLTDTLLDGFKYEQLLKKYASRSWRQRTLDNPAHVFNRQDDIGNAFVVATIREAHNIFKRERATLSEVANASARISEVGISTAERELARKRVEELMIVLHAWQPRSDQAARKKLTNKAEALDYKCSTTAFPRHIERRIAGPLRLLVGHIRIFCLLAERLYNPDELKTLLEIDRLSAEFERLMAAAKVGQGDAPP